MHYSAERHALGIYFRVGDKAACSVITATPA
jgi:hypothetical protein